MLASVTGDRSQVTRDTWQVTYDMLQVTGATRHVIIIFLKGVSVVILAHAEWFSISRARDFIYLFKTPPSLIGLNYSHVGNGKWLDFSSGNPYFVQCFKWGTDQMQGLLSPCLFRLVVPAQTVPNGQYQLGFDMNFPCLFIDDSLCQQDDSWGRLILELVSSTITQSALGGASTGHLSL